jgi:glycosyltransferase involved in cell wall biosynthesis
VIHNAVPPSSALEPLGDEPSAAFVGRINEWKGWEDFAEAAAMTHRTIPGSHFVIAGGTPPGSGRSVEDIHRYLSGLDPAQSWLRWVGEVTDPRSVMRSAWVVVVPSRRPEPLGNVVIEAMAEGRAVVGTNQGGIPEMVTDGVTGLLVSPGDAEHLADAMTRLLDDKHLAARFGLAGLERHRQHFSPTVHAEAFRAVLGAVLTGPDQRGQRRRPREIQS